jgi:hypothetical protein
LCAAQISREPTVLHDFPQKITLGCHFVRLPSGSNSVHLRRYDASAAWAQPGQDRKLAASPLTAAGNSFMDLPFSARAAFIWDHARQAIAWMNAAACAKFGLSPEGLSDALPKSWARKFAQHLDKAEAGEAACRTVKLKIADLPAFDCCLEVLELASGHPGLVVAEAEAQQSFPAQPLSLKAGPKGAIVKMQPKRTARAPALQTFKGRKAPLQQLTPEELRSFKAIGRAVRKLCREKRLAAVPALPRAASRLSYEQRRPAAQARATLCLPFSAFDVVLFLDEKLDIAGSEGSPQSLGWRKRGLLGQAVAQLLPEEERSILYRMVRKLGSSSGQIRKETIIVADRTGNGKPCHAVLGYCGQGNAQYYLALLALKIPRRLKKLQYQPVNMASLMHLAA